MDRLPSHARPPDTPLQRLIKKHRPAVFGRHKTSRRERRQDQNVTERGARVPTEPPTTKKARTSVTRPVPTPVDPVSRPKPVKKRRRLKRPAPRVTGPGNRLIAQAIQFLNIVTGDLGSMEPVSCQDSVTPHLFMRPNTGYGSYEPSTLDRRDVAGPSPREKLNHDTRSTYNQPLDDHTPVAVGPNLCISATLSDGSLLESTFSEDVSRVSACTGVLNSILPVTTAVQKPGSLVTWNVNGLYNVTRKGYLRRFLMKHSPDIILLTEIKMSLKKLFKYRPLHLILRAFGYKFNYYNPQTSGFGGLHGTAILSKIEASSVMRGWAHDPSELDEDGRCITAVFDDFVVVNTYTPCSSYPDKKMPVAKARTKDAFRKKYDKGLAAHCKFLKQSTRLPVVLAGDLNVCASSEDAFDNWRPWLDRYPSCKPWERESFHGICDDLGFVDTYRHFRPDAVGTAFTYWRTSDHWVSGDGFRLDYFLADPVLLDPSREGLRIADVSIEQGIKGSDHCPVFLTLARSPSPPDAGTPDEESKATCCLTTSSLTTFGYLRQ